MDILHAIRERRSVKRFTGDPVPRTAVEGLIEAATLAPNHRLTQPWRFYVLGPEARQAYGAALGRRKANKQPDPAKAAEVVAATAADHRALPAMLAVAMVQAESAEAREEDYAATMMAVQNLALAAVSAGLGTHIKTGGVMADDAARAAVGVPADQRIVAIVNLGVPAEVPPAKARTTAAELTTWVP